MAPARPNTRLKDLFTKAGVVDELQMRSALRHQEQWGGRLTQVVVELGFADEETLADAISSSLRMPRVKLGTIGKDGVALSKVEEQTCTDLGVFPVMVKDRALTLAMADPTDVNSIDLVQARAAIRVVPVCASESEITAAIARHYRGEQFHAQPNKARRAVTADVPVSGRADNFLELDMEPPDEPATKKTRTSTLSDVMRAPPGVNTLLDEMMGDEEGSFSAEDLERLEAARANQEKASTILRVVTQLLKEKGYA